MSRFVSSSRFHKTLRPLGILLSLLVMAYFALAVDPQSAEPTIPASQSSTKTANWMQLHFLANGTRFNPNETVLSPKNVGNLSVKWTYTTGSGPGIYSSAAVVDGVVYIGSDDDSIYALKAETGAELWSYQTGGFVNYSSPAIADGVVYVGSWDDNVYALSARTGAKLWSFTTGNYIDSSPAVANGVVYIGSADGYLYALNAETGAKVWSFNPVAPPYANKVTSSATVVNGVVYSTMGQSIYALNASTGAVLWSYTTTAIVDGSPTVDNNIVYFGSEDYQATNLFALNATTGAEVWTYSTGEYVSYPTPAIAHGIVYFASHPYNDPYAGTVWAFNARTGAKLWSYGTNGIIESSPAVANGVVYIGCEDNNVYALDAKDGALLWSYTTGSFIDSSPSVVNGMLFIGSEDRKVYAFDLK
jgi:eukaryotic-like serine/threonine-protein kinase